MVHNVHERALPVAPAVVGELVDRIAEPDCPLWPSPPWDELRLDRPLTIGATGGHGSIRYTCTDHVAGRTVEFTFDPSLFLQGTHTLYVLDGPTPDSCVLRHVIAGRLRGVGHLAWPLLVRWLHDAVLEDLLDNAATAVGHPPATPARWSPWVRVLYRLFERQARSHADRRQ